MTPDTWNRLAQGATLLTATQRLFRHLWDAFDTRQRDAGLSVWESPNILPYAAWLRHCWDEGVEAGAALAGAPKPRAPLLLSEAQEQALWEAVIAGEPEGRRLLQPSGTARLAHQARRLLLDWRLSFPADELPHSEESRVFLRWRKAFEARCAEAGWITEAELPDFVLQWIRKGAIAAPEALLLAGFDEFTPQQHALHDALRAAGTNVTEVHPEPRTGQAVRVACLDAEAEIETAARWVRGLLERGSGGTIAVVAPELGALREPIRRNFSAILAPGSLLPGGMRDEPFNISQGKPLADYPLVHAALEFLDLARDPLPLDRLSHLVRSPFVAEGEQEYHARALLDFRLRELGSPELPLQSVIRAAEAERYRDKPSPHRAPRLAVHLRRWREVFAPLRGRSQPAGLWAADFNRLLGALGWPGGLRLDSDAHQTWEKLLELFSTLAALELVLPPLTHGEALGQLRGLAARTQFQPEGDAAQVQILGALEAGGMTFEHLWVLGLHETAWPRPAEPNPFLPADWQRAHGLPQSSAARELAYARRMTERLLTAAAEPVFGYPIQNGEQPLRPSALIAALPEAEPATLMPSGMEAYGELLRAGASLEAVSDSQAPPLSGGDFTVGGTSLFKDQAACPFRAFARHRLHAEALSDPAHGLDPAERGSLVHKVMDRVWARLETSARLHGLSEQELRRVVADAAAEALEALAGERPELLRERFRALEHRRLVGLVEEFLALERERAPFTVVGRELEQAIAIGGIEVNTRIDRLDQLEGQGHVVIDYKTGKATWRDWQGERPEEPQLPLYCSSGELEVAAVAFARIRKGESAFHGLQAAPGLLPKATDFDAYPLPEDTTAASPSEGVLSAWRTVLERLGAQFRQGMARVDPKHPANTCAYCDMPPLCRIHDLGNRAEEEGDG
jgi:probable DNA repair protein